MAELLIDFITSLDATEVSSRTFDGRIQLLEYVPKVLAERTGDA